MSSIDILSPKGEGRLFSHYSNYDVGAAKPPLPSTRQITSRNLKTVMDTGSTRNSSLRLDAFNTIQESGTKQGNGLFSTFTSA